MGLDGVEKWLSTNRLRPWPMGETSQFGRTVGQSARENYTVPGDGRPSNRDRPSEVAGVKAGFDVRVLVPAACLDGAPCTEVVLGEVEAEIEAIAYGRKF